MKRRRSYDSNAGSCLPHIPDDIVFQILTWVPALHLVRFKTVSKQWRSWMNDPSFIELQKRKAGRCIIATAKHKNSIPVYRGGDDIFYLNKNSFRLLGSSSCGLLCIETCDYNYHILNPATGKSYLLPPLKEHSYALKMRVYIHPRNKQFSVAAFCKYSSTTAFRSKYRALFTIGVDSDWKFEELHVGIGSLVTWWHYLLCESGPMSIVKYGSCKTMSTLRLDPHTAETTSVVPPFYLKFKENSLVFVHEWDGKFAVSTVEEGEIDTWVLIHHRSNYWIHEKTVLPKEEGLRCDGISSICFVQRGKMWLKQKNKSGDFVSIDRCTNKVEKVTGNCTRIYELRSYFSTLEALVE